MAAVEGIQDHVSDVNQKHVQQNSNSDKMELALSCQLNGKREDSRLVVIILYSLVERCNKGYYQICSLQLSRVFERIRTLCSHFVLPFRLYCKLNKFLDKLSYFFAN